MTTPNSNRRSGGQAATAEVARNHRRRKHTEKMRGKRREKPDELRWTRCPRAKGRPAQLILLVPRRDPTLFSNAFILPLRQPKLRINLHLFRFSLCLIEKRRDDRLNDRDHHLFSSQHISPVVRMSAVVSQCIITEHHHGMLGSRGNIAATLQLATHACCAG